ncbi:MAG: hypothetical protein WCP65_00330 [Bacteroidota bacterium]
MINEEISLDSIEIGGETFFKISNVNEMPPFFMSIVSDSNHWMFISSNGGLTAGRKDADYGLFPYYTDDKITSNVENTGSKTIFWVNKNNQSYLWEPFSERGIGKFNYTRNLYKSKFGNKIIFEEINEDLGLAFQYQWNSSNIYGFVRISKLSNLLQSEVNVKLLDGLQNILPYGVGSDLQNNYSNLADAYKRTELIPETGLAIIALSAIIVDKAEPSEALKANVAWSLGFDKPTYLLSSLQLKNFRLNGIVQQEEDIKGKSGAYFVVNDITLNAKENKEWMIVANVNQNHAAIVRLSESIKHDTGLLQKVTEDVQSGTENLINLVAAADGLHYTADHLKDTRHFNNVMFNIMRGGIFDNNYQIEQWDFINYLRKANKQVFETVKFSVEQLPLIFSVESLLELSDKLNNTNFHRLAIEYLPLKFSRRHGDPSRPWNKFSINTKSEIDGSKILDYQGNWRDIFQNWEALAHSYPEFMEGMISKFLNASTFDGYNPYRVTKGGFDWETIEPDNPWSYIGYWGDHQIIYLLKFFEFLEKHRPGHIGNILGKTDFVYANVPYKIKSYADILHNPKDTIDFDHKSDHAIRNNIKELGADGALITNSNGEIYHVSFCEKVFATVLSKLSNLVPEGGIWMNTQRPEWNDANNALVGNGLSMVTLCYLRRFLKFFQPVFESTTTTEITFSEDLYTFFETISATFDKYKNTLSGKINDNDRKKITDALGIAGSNYRNKIYTDGFSGVKKTVTKDQLLNCISLANAFLEHSITANKRKDDLYHTYNLISYDDTSIQVAHLSEMLEGQVAVLSAGFLSAEESLKLLNALKDSALYRQDQNSYILYPDKNLAKFLQKNTIPEASAESSLLLKQLIEDGNNTIVEKDILGDVHFNGNFRNASDVEKALIQLDQQYSTLVEKEKTLILQIFEEVFCHKEFTGRSGTFFGYEGLGSIYWHMVSKLLLAVQETCNMAIHQQSSQEIQDALAEHFYNINEGIGVHKPPTVYGAFPTDPYSHTPKGKGAQQPGMTGQVKEDILTRMAELGVQTQSGELVFKPYLLHKSEFLKSDTQAHFVLLNGTSNIINLKKNSLAFTVCQVPVVYTISEANKVEVFYSNGNIEQLNSSSLSKEVSSKIFHRTNEVKEVKVYITEDKLR